MGTTLDRHPQLAEQAHSRLCQLLQMANTTVGAGCARATLCSSSPSSHPLLFLLILSHLEGDQLLACRALNGLLGPAVLPGDGAFAASLQLESLPHQGMACKGTLVPSHVPPSAPGCLTLQSPCTLLRNAPLEPTPSGGLSTPRVWLSNRVVRSGDCVSLPRPTCQQYSHHRTTAE